MGGGRGGSGPGDCVTSVVLLPRVSWWSGARVGMLVVHRGGMGVCSLSCIVVVFRP